MEVSVKMFSVSLSLYLCLVAFGQPAAADISINCTYQDVIGQWQLRYGDYSPKCNREFEIRDFRVVTLSYPDMVVDDLGNVGRWTLISNQAFEFTINYRKWLVLFDYDSRTKESLCHMSKPGWSRDVLIRQWNCFVAQKLPKEIVAFSTEQPEIAVEQKRPETFEPADRLYRANHDFIRRINSVQSSWKAVHYPELESFTLRDIWRRSGGINSMPSKLLQLPKTSEKPIPDHIRQLLDHLPEEFDWRYPPQSQPSPVTPVRNHGRCGSYYAFASAAMLESRFRLASNWTLTPVLSPQDVIDCSPYSEGCYGGIPYLIAGKYAEEFGMVSEKCVPYVGVNHESCTTPGSCNRFYATDYQFVGGYYGACHEDLMKVELVTKGPFVVSFEVYWDFHNYKSGIYHHTDLSDELNDFNPYESINYDALLVGYGVDNTTSEKYWAVKNSWGTEWGEEGFFRIRRGSDECSIESAGMSSDPVI